MKINRSQTGFRDKLGCEVNILKMTTEIKILMEQQESMNKKEEIWSLYIDLKSAFDTVDHEILF